MGSDTKTMPEAWRLWDRIRADSRIAFLPEPAGLEQEFRSVHGGKPLPEGMGRCLPVGLRQGCRPPFRHL